MGASLLFRVLRNTPDDEWCAHSPVPLAPGGRSGAAHRPDAVRFSCTVWAKLKLQKASERWQPDTEVSVVGAVLDGLEGERALTL